MDFQPILTSDTGTFNCGPEVTKSVLNALDGGEDMSEINKIFIVMIPKVPSPTSLTQFRPIILCNVIHKVV
jgi:hypothetical protein